MVVLIRLKNNLFRWFIRSPSLQSWINTRMFDEIRMHLDQTKLLPFSSNWVRQVLKRGFSLNLPTRFISETSNQGTGKQGYQLKCKQFQGQKFKFNQKYRERIRWTNISKHLRISPCFNSKKIKWLKNVNYARNQ